MALKNPSLKRLVEVTDPFQRLPTLVIYALSVAASCLIARLWMNTWVGICFAVFLLGDWVMLAALPWFRRSFGPPQLPWLALSALRLVPAIVLALLPGAWRLPVCGSFLVSVSLVATYACWVEPARLGVTCHTIRSPRLIGCPPLRLLHLSDLHVERLTARDERLLRIVEELVPDIIVVTGDYLNISYTFDATAQRQARELLGRLQAPEGVYAISGSPSVDYPEILAQLMDGLDVTWLRDEVTQLDWHGCHLRIAGIECTEDAATDGRKLERVLKGGTSDAFTILLYHTPDIMPAAAMAGVDLFLAGHTHGGQLRLPFYGAIVTASVYGKRYEMGAYREGRTVLYVSRGIGLEGKGLPRARFLSPPELTLFTLVGSDN